MSTTDQAKFKSDIKRIFDDKHAEMVKLAKQIEDIRGKVADGIWQHDHAQAEVEAVERKLAKARSECEAQARERIEQRLEELAAADALDADELTKDIELLRFDALTQSDIEQMAKRNTNNPTMCRLIDRYAAAHNLTVPMPDYIVELANAKKEAQGMEEVVRVGMRWVGDAKRGQSVLERIFGVVGL